MFDKNDQWAPVHAAGANSHTRFLLIYKISSSVEMIVVINHNHAELYITQEQA